MKTLGIVAFCLLASSTLADELLFERGGRVRAAATVDGDTVRIATPQGSVSFARSDFRRITPEPWPSRDWPVRIASAHTSDEKHSEALWAFEHGLVDEALAVWQALHVADPTHKPSARICEIAAKLAQSGEEPDLDEIQKLLPRHFSVTRSPHLVLLHEHSEQEAEERLKFLEKVLISFYIEFTNLGIDLPSPTKRLPSIWIADGDTYRDILEREGAGALVQTRGYYHPVRRLVLAYDSRSDTDQTRARDALVRQADQLRALEQRIDKLPPGARLSITRLNGGRRSCNAEQAREELAAFRRDLDRQRLLLDDAWRSLDLPIAAHELIHQLVAVSGLAPHYHSFPTWLHEGLAMQFEPVRGGDWAGLDEDAALRLRDWQRPATSRSLAALLRDDNLDQGYNRDAYAQAWCFVSYLRTSRPQTWLNLIDTLRNPSAAAADPRRRAREAILATANVDLPTLEREWLRHRPPNRTNAAPNASEIGQAAEAASPPPVGRD